MCVSGGCGQKHIFRWKIPPCFIDSWQTMVERSSTGCVELCIVFRRNMIVSAQWVKNLPAMQKTRDAGLIPGSERSRWRRTWQLTAVFLPGKSHGQRSLAGCSPKVTKSQIAWARTHVMTISEHHGDASDISCVARGSYQYESSTFSAMGSSIVNQPCSWVVSY